MKRIIIGWLALMPLYIVAQQKKVGDPFGYPAVGSVLNVPGNTLDLNRYRGKLLILDFWAPGCTACIAGFPKLDSLQGLFGDRLQIVAINQQSLDSTSSLLKRVSRIANPRFPLITTDSLLHAWYPHTLVPHVVWIDTMGYTMSITGGQSIDASHVSNYFAGKEVSFNQVEPFDSALVRSPLVQGVQSHVLHYSLLTRGISGNAMGNRRVFRDASGYRGNRITHNMTSAMRLFIDAFEEAGAYDFQVPRRWEIVGIDSLELIYPAEDSLKDRWMQHHAYNYDIQVPKEDNGRIFQFMQEDLQRYFGISAFRTKRKRPVYELVLIDKKRFDTGIGVGTRHSWNNITMRDVTRQIERLLMEAGRPMIVLDRTGIGDLTFSTSIRLPRVSERSLVGFNEMLEGLGLRLMERSRKVWVLNLKRTEGRPD